MDRTSSLGLWRYAKEFAEAANSIAQLDPTSIPAYYLVCHAIELALKAFLRGSGASLSVLKRLGHDLPLLFEKAIRNSLDAHCKLTAEHQRAVTLANRYYRTKEFEYITTGYKSLPKIDILQEAATRLVKELRGFCTKNRNWHAGRNPSGQP